MGMQVGYLLVDIIIKVMASIAIIIPMTMLFVRVSPKTRVPTKIAVIGSNTPSTDAFVAPMFRVATANVAVDMMVGRMARQTKLSQSRLQSMPVIISVPEMAVRSRNTVAPTNSA